MYHHLLILNCRRLTEEAETKEYQKQLRKRPMMISTAGPSNAKAKEKKKRSPKRSKKDKPNRSLTVWSLLASLFNTNMLI